MEKRSNKKKVSKMSLTTAKQLSLYHHHTQRVSPNYVKNLKPKSKSPITFINLIITKLKLHPKHNIHSTINIT